MLRTWRLLSARVSFLVFVALLSGTRAAAQTTALYVDSQPGESIGQGLRRTYTAFDGLTVQGLTPGNHDVAVFGWSGVSGRFVPACTVRVTVR
jgi:hypothetical protein